MGTLSMEEFLVIFLPIVVYWVYSGIYEALGSLERYRLHSKADEEAKNLASKLDVFKGVLFQQAIQASISFLILKATGVDGDESGRLGDEGNHSITAGSSLFAAARQFFVAMVVFDTWQYFAHRCMHLNKFLYRNFHSWHHRVVAPYAYAAQYNHPVDGIVTETLAGAAAFFASGMSTWTSVAFFCFATVKGIDDHCGLLLPWNPFHLLFGNNTAYHDVHHQLAGSKCNFAQPFFVMWDKMMGTYVPYDIVKRPNGGYEARIAKKRED